MIPTAIFIIAVGLFTASAAVVDLRMHRIPNYLTVPAALLGLVYHTLTPGGMGPLESLAGLGLGFCLLLIPALFGGGGMGDVKLLAALGAWLGPVLTLVAFATSVVCAALLATGVLLNSVMLRGVSKTNRKYVAARQTLGGDGKKRPKRVLPFAVPVALGTWALLAWMLSTGGM
jgi:prepilin peptidase CpaA